MLALTVDDGSNEPPSTSAAFHLQEPQRTSTPKPKIKDSLPFDDTILAGNVESPSVLPDINTENMHLESPSDLKEINNENDQPNEDLQHKKNDEEVDQKTKLDVKPNAMTKKEGPTNASDRKLKLLQIERNENIAKEDKKRREDKKVHNATYCQQWLDENMVNPVQNVSLAQSDNNTVESNSIDLSSLNITSMSRNKPEFKVTNKEKFISRKKCEITNLPNTKKTESQTV